VAKRFYNHLFRGGLFGEEKKSNFFMPLFTPPSLTVNLNVLQAKVNQTVKQLTAPMTIFVAVCWNFD
jgi:hypothetical protein